MIVGSLLLILVAVAMLGLGLVQGSNAFLVGSIAASLLAAIALVVGARRAAAARAVLGADAYDGLGDDDTTPIRGEKRSAADRPHRRRTEGTVYGREGTGRTDTEPAAGNLLEDERDLDERDRVAIPNQSAGDGRGRADAELDDDLDDEDPPDEPAAQIVPPADAARVARMSAPVLVIDGRPRYHQAGCVHLLGRESEPLQIGRASCR